MFNNQCNNNIIRNQYSFILLELDFQKFKCQVLCCNVIRFVVIKFIPVYLQPKEIIGYLEHSQAGISLLPPDVGC